jgi:hypothetical protein
MPPECFLARKPAGAAPRPAVTTPREERPSSGRGGCSVTEVWGEGISGAQAAL